MYVCGDGAGWIKRLLRKDLDYGWFSKKKIEFVIDKYHYKRDFNTLTSNNEYSYQEIINYYEKGDVTPFVNHESKLKELKSREGRNRYNFIINHKQYTGGWDKEDYLGCNMEMVMSHYICNRFKGSPKIWSNEIYKYSYGLCLLKNNKSEIELKKESNNYYIDDIKMKLKGKELYYGNFKDRSNITYINSGIRNGATRTLTSLSYPF